MGGSLGGIKQPDRLPDAVFCANNGTMSAVGGDFKQNMVRDTLRDFGVLELARGRATCEIRRSTSGKRIAGDIFLVDDIEPYRVLEARMKTAVKHIPMFNRLDFEESRQKLVKVSAEYIFGSMIERFDETVSHNAMFAAKKAIGAHLRVDSDARTRHCEN